MKVADAVAARFSARAFLDEPVETSQIRRILDRARRAPSGGNLQPWHVYVVCRAEVAGTDRHGFAAASSTPAENRPEYNVYPPDLHEPYRSRRYQCGEDLYAALGIPREDRPARLRQFAKNLQGFGAPMVLFFSIDRAMGQNQWAHLGMFMQTVMLLAVEEGLHTCPQEAWSAFHSTVAEFLGLPEEQMFYCGMAIGYADLAAPRQPVAHRARAAVRHRPGFLVDRGIVARGFS